jgi:TfoX/Sxy family transcriptional regulator of competence genes
MAYDEDLADRIREIVTERDGVSEKKMFGGLAFLVHGNMAVAASGQGGLLLRVDPARSDKYVDGSTVDRMVMRGRAMDGWLRVDGAAIEEDDDLRSWVGIGVEYAGSLPPK